VNLDLIAKETLPILKLFHIILPLSDNPLTHPLFAIIHKSKYYLKLNLSSCTIQLIESSFESSSYITLRSNILIYD
jgi:hypothetical protein